MPLAVFFSNRFGDIICEGTIEGNMTAEIFGDGDFVSRITVGNRLKVTMFYNFILVI